MPPEPAPALGLPSEPKLLDQLRGEGYPVREEDLAHVSPARYEHINPYGKYRFELDEALRRKTLRPIRKV